MHADKLFALFPRPAATPPADALDAMVQHVVEQAGAVMPAMLGVLVAVWSLTKGWSMLRRFVALDYETRHERWEAQWAEQTRERLNLTDVELDAHGLPHGPQPAAEWVTVDQGHDR